MENKHRNIRAKLFWIGIKEIPLIAWLLIIVIIIILILVIIGNVQLGGYDDWAGKPWQWD